MKGPYLEQHELEQLEVLLPHAIRDTLRGWKSTRLRGGSESMAFYGNISNSLLKAFDELAAEIKAQPEQEPWDNEAFSNWWDSDYEDSTNPYEKDSLAYWAWAGWQAALAQPEQEPVQYKCTVTDDQHPNEIPLEQWAKPPLTDKRVWTLWDLSGGDIADAIKAKLKEKNT